MGVKLCIKCISATVTVYICTVTVARAFNILVFFLSVGSVRERSSEWGNKKQFVKEMNILLNRCIE